MSSASKCILPRWASINHNPTTATNTLDKSNKIKAITFISNPKQPPKQNYLPNPPQLLRNKNHANPASLPLYPHTSGIPPSSEERLQIKLKHEQFMQKDVRGRGGDSVSAQHLRIQRWTKKNGDERYVAYGYCQLLPIRRCQSPFVPSWLPAMALSVKLSRSGPRRRNKRFF